MSRTQGAIEHSGDDAYCVLRRAGQIYVAGGVLVCTLCHFWVMQPGVLIREIHIVGADVLVVAGVAIMSGCTFTNSQMFLNGLGVGFMLAQLGGVLVCSGVTFTLNMGAIHASGAGTYLCAGSSKSARRS
jgi:hypothetical protein